MWWFGFPSLSLVFKSGLVQLRLSFVECAHWSMVAASISDERVFRVVRLGGPPAPEAEREASSKGCRRIGICLPFRAGPGLVSDEEKEFEPYNELCCCHWSSSFTPRVELERLQCQSLPTCVPRSQLTFQVFLLNRQKGCGVWSWMVPEWLAQIASEDTLFNVLLHFLSRADEAPITLEPFTLNKETPTFGLSFQMVGLPSLKTDP